MNITKKLKQGGLSENFNETFLLQLDERHRSNTAAHSPRKIFRLPRHVGRTLSVDLRHNELTETFTNHPDYTDYYEYPFYDATTKSTETGTAETTTSSDLDEVDDRTEGQEDVDDDEYDEDYCPDEDRWWHFWKRSVNLIDENAVPERHSKKFKKMSSLDLSM